MNQAQNSTDTPQAGTPIPWTQTLYWSIRRELWENRSIYVAPVVAAALMLIGFLFSLRHFSHSVRASADFEGQKQTIALVSPFTHAAWLIMFTALIVGLVYCLGALHNERSDRSILFWKSLPVSDLITVLAKASIPLLILPALVIVILFVLQLALLLLAAMATAGSGAAAPWSNVPWGQLELAFLYQLLVVVLWLAPVYAWLLLVSGWARRTVILWAVLPPLALAILERIALGTTYVFSLIRDRIVGVFFRAFDWTLPDGTHADPHMTLWSQATPGRFLSTPGLWLGLAAAAAMILAAARLRRFREPI